MLEQARFSLSRAGVMAGLTALLFLSAGVWFDPQKGVTDSYFSEHTWSNAQALLRHVKPETDITLPSAAAVPATCVAGSAGYAQLRTAAQRLDTELAQLSQTQFVHRTYRLDVLALTTAADFNERPCDSIQKVIQWVLGKTALSPPHFLQNLYWRERMPASQLAKLQANAWVAIPKSMLSMKSPWSGINGCVYGTDANTGAITWSDIPGNPSAQFCKNQLMAAGENHPLSVNTVLQLPSMAVVLQSMSPWRVPQHPDHPQWIESKHVTTVRGAEQVVGLHTQLSIDTRIQNRLQNLVSCYTASAQDDCPTFVARGEGRFEKARVRMAGLALVDIPTGKVLAAVSSQSPCFLHDLTRLGQRPTDCPELPLGTVHKPQWPQAPDNHALFKQAAPGSLVKPLLMSGILVSGGKYAGLEVALQKSDSHLFLDAWLCRKELGKGPFYADCERPQQTQRIAHGLGWNDGCDAVALRSSNPHCGELDLLWGQSFSVAGQAQTAKRELPRLSVMSGRILVQPVALNDNRWGYQDMAWPQSMPTAAQRADCANAAHKIYAACSGDRLGLVSEGYGQGNALTTPVGVSGLLSALANAAYQQPHQPPHLLVKVFRNDGHTVERATGVPAVTLQKHRDVLRPEIAYKVMAAMALTHKPGGTAHAACVGVWSTSECAGDLGIAGKTGTPGDADDRSIAQLQSDMQQRQLCIEQKDKACLAKYPLPRPRYRWYAALYKSGASEQYDKALTVLVHSNWRRADGRFADDQNAAAEIGMKAIRLLRSQGPTP